MNFCSYIISSIVTQHIRSYLCAASLSRIIVWFDGDSRCVTRGPREGLETRHHQSRTLAQGAVVATSVTDSVYFQFAVLPQNGAVLISSRRREKATTKTTTPGLCCCWHTSTDSALVLLADAQKENPTSTIIRSIIIFSWVKFVSRFEQKFLYPQKIRSRYGAKVIFGIQRVHNTIHWYQIGAS